MTLLAHITETRAHALTDHLQSVAKLNNSSTLSFMAGMLHDLGKIRDGFQTKLIGGEVSDVTLTYHSAAGAIHLLNTNRSLCKDTAFIGAAAIMSHHIGLTDDLISIIGSDASRKEYLEVCDRIPSEIIENSVPIEPLKFTNPTLMMRMQLSMLVHADWTDTGLWFGNYQQHNYSNLETLLSQLDEKLISMKSDTAVGKYRNEILELCSNTVINETVSGTPNWVSLAVPTGGGKTLAGMKLALKHAISTGKKKIIVVLPLMSIIDQTVDVYSRIFGSDNVLAHHSNIEPSDRMKYKQLSSSWEPPIVVTTMVQFLESLHANKPSKLRKIQACRDSVIILDEAQTLPIELLDCTIDTLTGLTTDHNSTIILSTATQPNLSKYNIYPQQIIPTAVQTARVMSRCSINYKDWGVDEIVNFATEVKSCLIVVNTRKHALNLYEQLQAVIPHTIHLSAYMHPLHRIRVIREIQENLKNKIPTTVVSTQIIDTGVDIDFPFVLREMAGADSIIQSAGRCNRNGNSVGMTFVFPQLSEKLPPSIISDISKTKIAMSRSDEWFDIVNHYQTLRANNNTDKLKIRELYQNIPIQQIRWAEITKRYRIINDDTSTVICAQSSDPKFPLSKQAQMHSVSLYDADVRRALEDCIIAPIPDLEDVYMITDMRWYLEKTGLYIPQDA